MKIHFHFLLIFIGIAMCGAVCRHRFECFDEYYFGGLKSRNRMYRLEIETYEHSRVLKEIRQESESILYVGPSMKPGNTLSAVVSYADDDDFVRLLRDYEFNYTALNFEFKEIDDDDEDFMREYLKGAKDFIPKAEDYIVEPPVTKYCDSEDDNFNEREVIYNGLVNKDYTVPKDTICARKRTIMKNNNPSKFSLTQYYPLETMYDWMDELAKQYEEVTLMNMGTSALGLPIKGLKLSRKSSHYAIFIASGIHGNKLVAPATAAYIFNKLLTSKEPEVVALANNFTWIVFPSINPDGYKYFFESDIIWGKQKALYGTCPSDVNLTDIADWHREGLCSDACELDSHGLCGGSELEEKRLIKFLNEIVEAAKIKTFLSLDSYSQNNFMSYNSGPQNKSNYDDLKEMRNRVDKMIWQFHGPIYKSGSVFKDVHPSNTDGSKVQTQGITNVPLAFNFELEEPTSNIDKLTVPTQQILATGEEILTGIWTIITEAAAKGYFN